MSQVKRIADYLIKHGLTVATAESCTGGMVAAGFTDLPGISACFGCGVVTYSNEAKEKLLGVSHETLVTYGAVSAETAAEMAEGLEKLSGADFAVSITGIAGPGGGSEEKPVGLVYFGLKHHGQIAVDRCVFRGDRREIRRQSRDHAYEMIVAAMEGKD